MALGSRVVEVSGTVSNPTDFDATYRVRLLVTRGPVTETVDTKTVIVSQGKTSTTLQLKSGEYALTAGEKLSVRVALDEISPYAENDIDQVSLEYSEPAVLGGEFDNPSWDRTIDGKVISAAGTVRNYGNQTRDLSVLLTALHYDTEDNEIERTSNAPGANTQAVGAFGSAEFSAALSLSSLPAEGEYVLSAVHLLTNEDGGGYGEIDVLSLPIYRQAIRSGGSLDGFMPQVSRQGFYQGES